MKVSVCKNCLRASCQQGEFSCSNSGEVVKMDIEELKKLDLEDSGYWFQIDLFEGEK